MSALAQGVAEFALQMTVGVAVRSVGGLGLRRLMRLPLPNEALYPVRVLAAAGIVYGAATVLSGSGFLAVVRAPYKREIEQPHPPPPGGDPGP